jgi:hypothetical protein
MKRKSVMLLLASMLMFTGCGNTSNTTVSEDTEVTSEVESESEIEDDETSINYDIIDEAGVVTFGSDNVTFELEVVDSTEFKLTRATNSGSKTLDITDEPLLEILSLLYDTVDGATILNANDLLSQIAGDFDTNFYGLFESYLNGESLNLNVDDIDSDILSFCDFDEDDEYNDVECLYATLCDFYYINWYPSMLESRDIVVENFLASMPENSEVLIDSRPWYDNEVETMLFILDTDTNKLTSCYSNYYDIGYTNYYIEDDTVLEQIESIIDLRNKGVDNVDYCAEVESFAVYYLSSLLPDIEYDYDINNIQEIADDDYTNAIEFYEENYDTLMDYLSEIESETETSIEE